MLKSIVLPHQFSSGVESLPAADVRVCLARAQRTACSNKASTSSEESSDGNQSIAGAPLYMHR